MPRAHRKPQPVTDADRRRVAELHARGMSRNAIARELGRSPRTVSVIAAEAGLSFSREATEDATRARMADLAELRAQLAHELTVDALRLTAQMWQPTTVYAFGGRENTYAEKLLPEAPAADKRALMAAATAAAAESRRLVPPEGDGSPDEVGSLLGAMMAGLQERHGTDPAPGDDDA